MCYLRPMNDWVRIGDDELAPFGVQSHCFAFPHGRYLISVDQSNQNYVDVVYQGKTERWPIDLKHQKGDNFRLSGMADWIPELMDDYCWYELFLGKELKITYWGNRVVYRTDLPSAP